LANHQQINLINLPNTPLAGEQEDDYGLGSQQEIEQDDEDEPLRKVPVWAAGPQVLAAMEQQDDYDPAMLFGPCGPPRLSLIFTQY
jgi:hypothetical protein